MTKPILLITLLSFGAIAQQITNPNTGAWAGDPGQQVFSPFPLDGKPQWEPSPDGKADTQLIFDYLEPGILACAGAIGSLNNSVFAIQTQMTTFQTSLDTLSGNISALSQNQRTTGTGGGGAVAVPSLDAVLSVSGNAPSKSITVYNLAAGGEVDAPRLSATTLLFAKELQVETSAQIGGGLSVGGKITGVSDPEDDSDAATKNYVDTTFAPASTNSIVVYTITGVTATGFTLSPIRLIGVTGTTETGSPSFEFAEQDVVSAVTSDSSKLSQSRRKALIHVTSPSVSTEIIQFVDHGSFGN